MAEAADDTTFEEQESPPPQPAGTGLEKLACQNCRQRKVKCDRAYPCSHCTRSNVPCIFPLGQRPRAKRQRVLISSIYEKKIDRIAQSVEQLNAVLRRMNISHPTPESHASPNDSLRLQSNPSPCSSRPTPSSLAETSVHSVFIGGGEDQNEASHPEYEGESSLFAQAVYATEFLQCSLSCDPSSRAASEMNSVLNALRNAVDAQKQRTDTLQNLYPNARQLPPGANLRDLPLPDTHKVLACLRMAEENPQIQVLWLMQFQAVNQFTTYFIRVCSPGPATAADMCIVHAGLYWLFLECANAVTDESLKHDYGQQAVASMANLETILSRLPFHIPATLDYVYALSMASMYCLQKSKPTAAWNFICSASQMCQTLGLHSNAPLGAETNESRQGKAQLFWAVYTVERMLALRLGRSSTIRDHDITLPRIGLTMSRHALINELFPIWIEISKLQGRVYDEIYSPGSLAQPEAVRTSNARALADEAKRLLQAQDGIQRKHVEAECHPIEHSFNLLMWRAERVTGLSMLTLIYRSIPPDKSGGSVFSKECIDTARDALREHEKCLTFLVERELHSSYFEVYMSWVFLQSPFTPFIVLFCHMIETSDASDLDHLRNLVEALLSVSKTSCNPICQKQLSLFKALYDVAVEYFEVKKTYPSESTAGVPQSTLEEANTAGGPATISVPELQGGIHTHMDQSPSQNTYGLVGESLPWETQTFNEFGGEANRAGAELAPWFYTNMHMMRMLDDM